MPTKVMILAQFDPGYYIRGALKRLTDVVARLKAWWICDSWICLKTSWICTRNPCPRCLAGEEMPAKVVILAQFGHQYYIRETSKRLTDVVAWLKAWWICIRNPCHCCLAGEEMPTKVPILAQFDPGYYIRGALKRLTDVVARLKAWWICWLMGVLAWLKAWWICEMPAKVVIFAQFGHGYYIRGTLKRLTDVVAWIKAWWICVFWLGSGLRGIPGVDVWNFTPS
ncbi:hypothetical protein C8R44DRAFT_725059 [Mycena epipterygia]|nr:hypothetical protein C8R44DRAFT_725059 [Mycena epipterygia]